MLYCPPPSNHTYILKLGFIFLISAQNMDCGYSLELLNQTAMTSAHGIYLGRGLVHACFHDVISTEEPYQQNSYAA